jgi:hypothetical protein
VKSKRSSLRRLFGSRIGRYAATASAAIFVVFAATLAFADDGKPSKIPPLPHDSPEEYERIVSEAVASFGPQTEFLEQFNSGARSVGELPIVHAADLPVEYGIPSSEEQMAVAAELVAVATAEEIWYSGSGMADIPGTSVRYTIDEVLKGELKAGDSIVVGAIGGPYQQPGSGEELYFQFLETPMERPGDQSLLFLVSHEVGYAIVDTAGRLPVVDGNVLPREDLAAYFGDMYEPPGPRPLEEVRESIALALGTN